MLNFRRERITGVVEKLTPNGVGFSFSKMN